MTRVPPDLPRRVARTTRDAGRCGALQPIATRLEQLEVDGLPFQLRTLVSSDAPSSGTGGHRGAGNPFLAPEPVLRVCDLGPEYFCLLNKYPVARDHLLIVSCTFQPQCSPLTEEALTLLLEMMASLPSLGFYNAGPLAGASQAHRHLQLIPEASLGPLALDTWLQRGRALPFVHRYTELPEKGLAVRARVLEDFYRRTLAAWGYSPDRNGLLPPYNLLVSRRWAFLVPRTRADYRGLSVNALGFAGALLLPDPGPRVWLAEEGIAPVLAAVSA